MSYTFYPRKDDPCPNVGHCPHAGGAAISVLVLRGNDNEEYHRYLNGTIDAQREQISKLVQENQKLESDLAQAKLELKLERQNKFATSKQVSRDILGNDFTGTLVTDCYSGYFASVAGAKQKCLAHVSRKARDLAEAGRCRPC